MNVQPLAISAPSAGEHDVETVSSLPDGHPAWQRDLLAVSARTRALIASLRPFAVRVLTFWDHATRSVRVGARQLEIDPSGSYRLR